MIRLNPYLNFNGNCRKAMEFYRDCLGGELKIMTVGDSPMAAQMPQMKDRVMHALLETPDMVIMASDMMGSETAVQGNTLSLCINGDDQEEIKRIYDRLSENAKTIKPLKQEFFGLYGDLTDKFGILWMFQSGPTDDARDLPSTG